MKRLKIVLVSGHHCIRVTKEAMCLAENGHNLHVIAKRNSNFDYLYKTFLHYFDIGQCIESIKLHPDADIFHVDNEPSWFVCAIKEVFPNKPVILDVHDTYLSRSTDKEMEEAMSKGLPHVRITTEERNSFQAADGLVFVSNEVRDLVLSEFSINKPSIVLPSYVPNNLYQYHTQEWMGGLVYEGRVTLPEENEGLNLNTGAYYCDYIEVAKKARKIGIDFHLYAGREDEPFKKLYSDEAFVHPGYDYMTLLKKISRHDWGLVGNLIDSPQWQMTTPNKLFDCLAAGVPSVCINATASSKIVKDYGIGITVDSMEELASRWAEHRECRANIWKNRQALSMNSNIHLLLDLYKRMI
jgi:glycosyltransferase involved in cell wall biosynthesis